MLTFFYELMVFDILIDWGMMPGLVVVVGCAMVMGGGRGCREEKEEETYIL